MTTRASEPNNRPLLTIAGPLPVRSLSYLATPYTKYDKGIEWAFREASRLAGELLVAGVEVYSPIAHCHPLSIYAQIDALDRDFWLRYQEAFMSRCDALIVAKMKGWKESIGIHHEIKFFIERRRPVFMLDPDSMNMRRITTPLAEIDLAAINHQNARTPAKPEASPESTTGVA